MTHEELKAKALKNAEVKKEYDKLELEFKLFIFKNSKIPIKNSEPKHSIN